MFCSRCGAKNPDGVRFCGACGAPTSVAGAPPRPATATPAPAPSAFAGVGAAPSAAPAARLPSPPALVATLAVALGALFSLQDWVLVSFDSISPLVPYGSSIPAPESLATGISGTGTIVRWAADAVNVLVESVRVYASDDVLEMAGAVNFASGMCAAFLALQVACVALASIAAYNALSSGGADLRVMPVAGAACALAALGWIVALGVVNGALSDALARSGAPSSAVGSLLEPTGFVWATLACGIVALAASLLGRRAAR